MNSTETNKKTPSELMPLATDIAAPVTVVTPEDKEELMRMAVERAGLIPKR